MTGRSAGKWPDVATELRSLPVPWWTVLATGVCAVVFGAAVLIWPDVSLRIMAALTGVWLLVAGVTWIAGAFLPRDQGGVGRQVRSGIVGIAAVVAGLACLRGLVSRLAVLALLFAITWILSGLAGILAGVRRTGPARAGFIAVGLLSLIAGGVFLLLPDLSLSMLVLLTGVSGLVVGLAEVVLALILRRGRPAEPTDIGLIPTG